MDVPLSLVIDATLDYRDFHVTLNIYDFDQSESKGNIHNRTHLEDDEQIRDRNAYFNLEMFCQVNLSWLLPEASR
jgi:hypothetical protein